MEAPKPADIAPTARQSQESTLWTTAIATLRLSHSEWFRLRRRVILWALLGLYAGIIGLFYLLMWFVLRSGGTEAAAQFSAAELRDQLGIGDVPNSGMQRIEQFGALFVVILASSLVATEFTWGTIRTILPRAPGRMPFLTAKIVIALGFAVALVIVGFAVSLAMSGLVTAVEGLHTDLDLSYWQQCVTSMGKVLFVMLPYIALAMMVSLWTRSSAAGIGVTLGILLLEPIVMGVVDAAGGSLARLPEFFLSRNVSAVLDGQGRAGPGGDGLFGTAANLPPARQAALVLGFYAIAFTGLFYWRFSTRDIQSG